MEQRIDKAFKNAEVVTLEKMTAIYRGTAWHHSRHNEILSGATPT
jgi:hypothetical protein